VQSSTLVKIHSVIICWNCSST